MFNISVKGLAVISTNQKSSTDSTKYSKVWRNKKWIKKNGKNGCNCRFNQGMDGTDVIETTNCLITRIQSVVNKNKCKELVNKNKKCNSKLKNIYKDKYAKSTILKPWMTPGLLRCILDRVDMHRKRNICICIAFAETRFHNFQNFTLEN